MQNNKIIIAFSGGPDSVFLCEYLLEKKYAVVLAHFNHHMDIRKGANNADEQFVQNYAKQKNIPLEIGHWGHPEPSEEKARNARYKFLETIRAKYNAQWICTGHHLNDNAETIMLQFLRGGGIRSLTGILETDEKRKLWRPILSITKQTILEELDRKQIQYCIDSSNAESVFTRNFLRNEIFPKFEKKFPNFQKRLSIQTHQMTELQKYLETQAEYFLETQKKEHKKQISTHDFLQLPSPLRFEVLKKIIIGKYVDNTLCESIYDFLATCTTGKIFETKAQRIRIQKKFFSVEMKNDTIV